MILRLKTWESRSPPSLLTAVYSSSLIHRVRMKVWTMKVISSLKSARSRHKDCKLVRRKGRLLVINKTNPKFKAKQA